MKKIKDLMCFKEEKTEEAEERTELETERKIGLKDKKIEKQNEGKTKKDEIKKEKIKYIKYENGRLKYLRKDLNRITLIDKIKNFFNKDNIFDKVNKLKKEKNYICIFMKRIFIIFLVFSVVFVYFYYFKDHKMLNNTVNNNVIIQKNIESEKDKNKNITQTKNDVLTTNTTLITIHSISNKINIDLKNIELKELNKINDYLNLKANRNSVKSLLEKNRKIKENLYIDLTQNKEVFKANQSTYNFLKNKIIKSIAFNDEILEISSKIFTKAKIKKTIDKYNLNF